MSFSNKIALITGASSGIGAAIATKLTEEGAKVAIVGRNPIRLKNVSDICEKYGSKPLTIIADVTKDDDAKRLVNETVKNFGRLDVLVNNAGVADRATIFDEKAINVFDKVINTNLRAAVVITHLAAKYIVESKGNIINISSVASKAVLSTNASAYSASKAALDHFTRSMALELAVKGVRVNAVNAGPVKTNIVETSTKSKEHAEKVWILMKKGTALDRIADAEEIADLVAYLASDKARSITGTTILSDNGTLLKGLINKQNYYNH